MECTVFSCKTGKTVISRLVGISNFIDSDKSDFTDDDTDGDGRTEESGSDV
ncbi:unnamed protein product [Schistosoma mattheei]|uniref:Uncharacterized protein n=1 Tax=Schistosoma mattheei TaxID=31246 RepID=A0A3P8FAF0_9TREM|nr:unnamed protein product [Schistosoma mattheei]